MLQFPRYQSCGKRYCIYSALVQLSIDQKAMGNTVVRHPHKPAVIAIHVDFILFKRKEASVVQWQHAGLLVNRLSDRSCTGGMIHNKIHLISPGCLQALTSAELWPKTPIISFYTQKKMIECGMKYDTTHTDLLSVQLRYSIVLLLLNQMFR